MTLAGARPHAPTSRRVETDSDSTECGRPPRTTHDVTTYITHEPAAAALLSPTTEEIYAMLVVSARTVCVRGWIG